MRIGIDIDGTITNFEKFICLKGEKFFNKKGWKADYSKGIEFEDIFSVEEHLKMDGVSATEIVRKKKSIIKKFWTRFYCSYCRYPIREGVSRTMKRLYEEHEVYLITSRYKSSSKSVIGLIVRLGIYYQLYKNDIHFNKIYFLPNDEKKKEIIAKLTLDVMVDDKIELLQGLNTDIIRVGMETQYNQKYKNAEEIFFVKTWDEVGDFIFSICWEDIITSIR